MKRIGPKVTKPRVVAKIRRSKAIAYTNNWATISDAVIKRDGNRCTKCGCKSSPGNRLRAHHIIPVSRGGRTIQLNLKTLCDNCHKAQPFHSHLRGH